MIKNNILITFREAIVAYFDIKEAKGSLDP
jgi:hypothetical protein